MSDHRHPIGEFVFDPGIDQQRRLALIEDLAGSASRLRQLMRGLSDTHLDTPYRTGGWTMRQVAHHVADSSLNWYIRLKVALTETVPTIKPFDQDAWSGLVDARTVAPEVSVNLLEAVHARMAAVLRSLKPADWHRTMHHAERGEISVDYTLQTVAWHARHHLSHIEALRAHKGW